MSSYFFSEPVSIPAQVADGTREAPEEAKMVFEHEEEGPTSPLSPNSTFSGSSNGSGDMSQDDVSKLVHNALRRARKATTPKTSPRESPSGKRPSKKSQRSPSPPPSTRSYKSITSADNLKSFDSMEASYPKHLVEKEDAHAAALLSSIPIKEPPKIRMSSIETSLDEHLSPSKNKPCESNELGPNPVADSSDSAGGNCSSAVIRRVEEEIANAKKAAEEAQQRLAYALSSRSSNSWSIDEPALSPSMGLADMLDRGNSRDSNDMRGILSVSSGEEDLDEEEKLTEVTETSFVIAREMITEEFNDDYHEGNEKFENANNEEPTEENEAEEPVAVVPDDPPMAEATENDPVQLSEDESPSEQNDAPEAKGKEENEQSEDETSDDLVKASAPSEDSAFLGTIDETMVSAIKNIDNTEEEETGSGEQEVGDSKTRDIVEKSYKTESSPEKMDADAPIEEKKEDSPLAGPWNGFLSSFMGTKNAENEDNYNNEGEDPAKVVNDADTPDTQEYLTPKSKDAMEDDHPSPGAESAGQESKPVVKTPWWASPDIPTSTTNAESTEPSKDNLAKNATGLGVNTGEDPSASVSDNVVKSKEKNPIISDGEASEDAMATNEKRGSKSDGGVNELGKEITAEPSVSESNDAKTANEKSAIISGDDMNDSASKDVKGKLEKGSSETTEAVQNGIVPSNQPKPSAEKCDSTKASEGYPAKAYKDVKGEIEKGSSENAKAVQNGNVSSNQPKPSAKKYDSTKASGDPAKARKPLIFKEPYPTPQPLATPRPPEEIIKDSREPFPELIVRWSNPKPQLQDLLLAAKGDSLARRSNALGALKVLSLKKKNQLTLARTRGFLDSVVHAASAAFPPDDEELGLTAKARAVVTLLHVSEPKDNRNIVFGHPGLPEALVKVIQEDHGEARAHACGALAMLAKTATNREAMVEVENLVAALSLVVMGTEARSPVTETEDEEGVDIEEKSDDGSESSASSADDSTAHSDDGSTGSSQSESSEKPVEEIIPDVKSNDSIKMQKESMQNEFVTCGRYNACAALLHLSKHCAISHVLCDNETFLDSMMTVSIEFDNRIHTKCIEILCNITRFQSNNPKLARNPALVDTFVTCGKSTFTQDRVWSMRGLQNIAADSSNKLILATSPILTLLSICAVRTDYDEQVAAVATLYNLSTDAGAVVPLTNTKNIVATLVHLAHDSNTSPDVRQMACDALATIGLWLQTLASAGTAPEGLENVPLPTHATAGWERWD